MGRDSPVANPPLLQLAIGPTDRGGIGNFDLTLKIVQRLGAVALAAVTGCRR